LGTDNPIGKIILFDGVCNLCNSSVQFIIRRDPHNVFRFASLQSEFAKNILHRFNRVDTTDTIILIDQNKMMVRSDAALEIARHLSGVWPACYVMKVIPRFIRDYVYQRIAKNRYRWFGRADQCSVPTPAIENRFIKDQNLYG
jgi:predicted DCC family thiol-disulfide oxidoreductase YuxK